MVLTQKQVVKLAEEGNMQRLRDEAIKEYAKVLGLNREEIMKISIEMNPKASSASADLETRTIEYNPNISGSGNYSADYMLAESIYEEVMHMLTTYETFKESHGTHRNLDITEWTMWHRAVHEIMGGFHRIVDEKFDLERSFKKSEKHLWSEPFPPNMDFETVRSAIYHFAGYKIAASIGRDIEEIRKIARMSSKELRDRFPVEDEDWEINKELIRPEKDETYWVLWDKKGWEAEQITFQKGDNLWYQEFEDGDPVWTKA
jgi:hypothetical protein